MTILRNRILMPYFTTVLALLTVLFFIFERLFLHFDLYVELARYVNDIKYLRTEETALSIGLISLALAFDQFRMIGRRKRRLALEADRLAVARTTLATVHDTVNNSLNNMLLVKIEAERGHPLSPETLVLFGNLIDNMASDLRAIEEVHILSKRNLSQDISVLNLD